MREIPPVIEQKLLSKIQAGDTGILANFWVSRPTIPLTEDRFLERQSILTERVSKASVAVSHPHKGQGAREIYLAYIEDGVAKVKSAPYKVKMSSHIWRQESFSTWAEDVAICFDGSMPNFADNTAEFITKGNPWVFWVLNGVLKGQILGFLGEVTLATTNCTRVSAIRAVQSDIRSLDFGLVVFFILSGSIYYRQLINGEWTDAEFVSLGPEGVTWEEISAFRTWDYRIGLQAKTSTGALYEMVTQYQGVAKHGTEHIQILNPQKVSTLTEVTYHDTQTKEHIQVASASWGALYGGLYASGAPAIISAYNVADVNEDWGTTAIFVFDKHLVAAEVAAQYTAFSIVDSRNVTFIATSATLGSDGKTVTLTFLDYNNANGVCAAKYTPGTVTSMAGTTLVATSFNWTPQNLVPSLTPAPEVYSIANVGITDIGYNRVRFYDTTGGTLLYTEYVHDGDDCEYGTDEVWAITANSGTIAVDITENVENSMDLYLARWRVRYYSKDGQTLSYTEYVVDGEDAEWGAGRDWSSSAGGQPVSGILTDIHANTDVYSYTSYLAIEWIQATGTQWIDTGVTPTINTVGELPDVVPIQSTRYGSFLAEGNSSGRIWALRYNNTTGRIQCQIGSDSVAANGPVLVMGQQYSIRGELGKLTVDGVEYTSSGMSLSNPMYTLRLFHNGAGEPGYARIGTCRIYENGVLIRDFHAALDPSNVPCMFDEVSGNYYYNGGSGTFKIPTNSIVDVSTPLLQQMNRNSSMSPSVYTAQSAVRVLVINQEIIHEAYSGHTTVATISTTGTVISTGVQETSWGSNYNRDSTLRFAIIDLSAGDTVTLANSSRTSYISRTHLIFKANSAISVSSAFYDTIYDNARNQTETITLGNGHYLLWAQNVSGSGTGLSAGLTTTATEEDSLSLTSDTYNKIEIMVVNSESGNTATFSTSGATNYVSKVYSAIQIGGAT